MNRLHPTSPDQLSCYGCSETTQAVGLLIEDNHGNLWCSRCYRGSDDPGSHVGPSKPPTIGGDDMACAVAKATNLAVWG